MGEKGLIASVICLAVCIGFMFILPQVGISVADFVIGAQNKDATCDAGALVRLSTWLFINGAIGLFFAIMLVIMFIVIIVVMFVKPELVIAPAVPLIIMIVVFSCFNLAWNIIGAVALFRDSMECLDQTKPIWAMTLASLILQWLSMFQTLCSPCAGSAKAIDS